MVRNQPASEAGATDFDLVILVGNGDESALAALYDRYSGRCFALARRITSDTNFAEDVVQEVFLLLWRAPEKFDPGRGAFGVWLMVLTHHKAVDIVRREERLRRHKAAMATGHEAPPGSQAAVPIEDQVWTGLCGDHVRAALQALPDTQREALALAYFGGYTQREVAALTGAPLGTVKTRMWAGMRRLAGLLGDATDAGGAADEEVQSRERLSG